MRSLAVLLLLPGLSFCLQTRRNQPPPSQAEQDRHEGKLRCVDIKPIVCQGLPYNSTLFPNVVGIATQAEAEQRMTGYQPLLFARCSDFLKIFLCSVYFPMCDNKAFRVPRPLKPCTEFCQHVKGRCAPLMNVFNFLWPADLKCDNFPQKSNLCLLPDLSKDMKPRNLSRKVISDIRRKFPNVKPIKHRPKLPPPPAPIPNLTCSPAEVRVSFEPNDTCLTRCLANVLFTAMDKRFAEVWTTVWAVCCLASSVLTAITFAADSARFRYPERPIVYLCVCYLFYSLTFIIREAVGAPAISCRELDHSSDRFLIRGGHEGTWCTITFLINYFFITASGLWWVILTIAWFLSAAKKWGHEGVEAISSLFHMVAWGGPAVCTIVILIMHKIDGDELTGMCFVGSQDPHAKLIFVLLPMCAMLVTGIGFLLCGFASLVGVRNNLKMKEEAATANIRR